MRFLRLVGLMGRGLRGSDFVGVPGTSRGKIRPPYHVVELNPAAKPRKFTMSAHPLCDDISLDEDMPTVN
jgi:hypothetical protein